MTTMRLAIPRSIDADKVRLAVNVVVFEAAWFACVLGAAHGWTSLGIAAVAAAVLLHLRMSEMPARDAALVALALVVGLAWDTAMIHGGWVAYASPGPWPSLAPAWILALWALFATALRLPLRWLHGRPWLAALFGGIGGPLSYAGAARLGACRLQDGPQALLVLAAGWALITPLLIAGARRLERHGEAA